MVSINQPEFDKKTKQEKHAKTHYGRGKWPFGEIC